MSEIDSEPIDPGEHPELHQNQPELAASLPLALQRPKRAQKRPSEDATSGARTAPPAATITAPRRQLIPERMSPQPIGE